MEGDGPASKAGHQSSNSINEWQRQLMPGLQQPLGLLSIHALGLPPQVPDGAPLEDSLEVATSAEGLTGSPPPCKDPLAASSLVLPPPLAKSAGSALLLPWGSPAVQREAWWAGGGTHRPFPQAKTWGEPPPPDIYL